MYYIVSDSTDPYYNLALEQYVFDYLDRKHEYFMLWQNHNTIVVGKHQNTIQEINLEYVKENHITVARRLSGGGAVYHDMGNLCFTFIVDGNATGAFDFASFCRPVAAALSTMGVAVEISGRNDMTIDGKKFSGNSQYRKHGRIMHHGTLMFDSNLNVVSNALRVSQDKIESKGIKSVRSRITNIKPYLKTNKEATVDDFRDELRQYMFKENDMKGYELTDEDRKTVKRLSDEIYSTWEWNYGASPAYTLRKTRRIEGCGKIEMLIDTDKQGCIKDIVFYGDYFSQKDAQELCDLLKKSKFEETAIRSALKDVNIQEYFNNIRMEDFISILMH